VALRLHSEGHQVGVSVTYYPKLSPRVLELERKGIDLFIGKPAQHNLPVRLWNRVKRRFVVEEKKEIQWLRLQKPDLVIISQGGNSDGVGWMNVCMEMGLPFAAIIQCNTEGFWPDDDWGVEMARAYRAAQKVFCVSRHNLELLERQIGESLQNAVVVWNPYNISTDQLPVWPKDTGVWKMACVARLDPAAKGQDLLLQALAQKRWQERPVEFNLYGSGRCEQNLLKFAKSLQLKNVHFRGHIENVKAIWEENHLLVMPSRFEGLPLALVEAMWCARPSVVTDVGGNSELCVDEETGFVAEASTVKHLDQTLDRAWSRRHEWQSMGKVARERAEKLISKDPIGDFCQHLNECVNRLKVKIEKPLNTL